nr:hypothetical protein [bacterium]
MDGVIEQVIAPPRKMGGGFKAMAIITTVVCAMMVLFLMQLMMTHGLNWPMLILMLACVLVGFLSFYVRNSRDVEFDLLLVEDELRVARVVGHNRRKELFRVSASKWNYFGPVDMAFARYSADKSTTVHMLVFGQPDEMYYLAFEKEGKQHLLVFVPTDDMLNAMKRLSARGRRI